MTTSDRLARRLESVVRVARGRFALEVSSTVFATGVTIVAGSVQSVLVARTFGPTGKGLYTLVFLVPGTLGPLLSSGFSASLVYFASRAPTRVLNRHLFQYALLASLGGFALIGVAIASGKLHATLPALNGLALALAIVAIPIMILQGVVGALVTGLGQLPRFNVIRCAQAIATTAAVILAISVLHSGPEGVAVAALLVTTCAVIALVTLIAPHGFGLGWDKPLRKQQLSYAARDHAGAVLQFLNYRLDQMILVALLDTRALGLYSVAVSLSEMLWVVPDSIATAVFPKVARGKSHDSRRPTIVAFGISLALSSIGAIGLAILGRAVVRILFSARFTPSFEALRWLLPGAALLGPAKVLTGDLAGRGHPLVNSAAAGVGLVATVALDLALIPRYGIRGAAIASSIAYSLVAVLALVAFLVIRPRPGQDDANNATVG